MQAPIVMSSENLKRGVQRLRVIPLILKGIALSAMLFSFAFAAQASAQSVVIPKSELSRFVGTVVCNFDGDECPEAQRGFATHGLNGEAGFEDPTSMPKDAVTGKSPLVLGFPDSKSFDLNRYACDLGGSNRKLIILNELSTSDANHVFLSEWKVTRTGYELVRLLPTAYDLALGEVFYEGKPMAYKNGTLVLLRGIGSDAGVNLQDYRVIYLSASGKAEELAHATNRSEIPVADILARLNEDQSAEAVMDSSLYCSLSRNKVGLKCTKSRTRIVYSKAGPEETPVDKSDFFVNLGKQR